jgi:hypothetical protein
MHARHRRPTIRRVRDCDWQQGQVVSLRPPRLPLDLVALNAEEDRVTAPGVPGVFNPPEAPSNDLYREEVPLYEEEERTTLARLIPLKSDVHAILDDPEKTLAYIRKMQASLPDPDSALDSLVAVYEDRVAKLAKERAHAAAIVAQAHIAADETERPKPKPRRKQTTTVKRNAGAMAKLQPHIWKIVFSTICVWGLVQLALMR